MIWSAQVQAPPPLNGMVVVDWSPASSGRYIGSPSLAVLPDGSYLASHDFFGPGSTETTVGQTVVFRSSDRGSTWTRVAQVRQFWSQLFLYRGSVFLLGTDRNEGSVSITRSDDGGSTWRPPVTLFKDGRYACAPTPVIKAAGRIWHGMELAVGTQFALKYRALLMSAREGSDLMNPMSWQETNSIPGKRSWLEGKFNGWLEGNAVVDPGGQVVDVLRTDLPQAPEKCAIAEAEGDGKSLTFDPSSGFANMPGGCKKFAIRQDPATRLYWTVSNRVIDPPVHRKPGETRNALTLSWSNDLKSWWHAAVVAYDDDPSRHGFQYADFQFDGPDLIVLIRTAEEDGHGGAHNYHDANMLTFKRIRDFRKFGPSPRSSAA